MTDAKTAVYEDLVEVVTAVVDRTFERPRPVTIDQQNWYPDLELRSDTMIPYESDATIWVESEDEADLEETIDETTRYFKRVENVPQRLTTALERAGIVAEAYHRRDEPGMGIYVYGWDRDPPWFQVGDYVKLYRWRTPMRVIAVAPPGERPPEDFPLPTTGDGEYIGAGTLHLCLDGQRGGQYLLDDDGETTGIYQRPSSDSPTLEKMADTDTTIFVGNPETGPRLTDDGTDAA